MSMITKKINHSTSKGVSLVEVLVALFTLSVGLLGLATMQTKTIQFNQSAYLRTQATLLSNDIIERYRAYNSNAPSAFLQSEITAWENLVAARLPEGSGVATRVDDTIEVTITWKDRDERETEFAMEANL